MATATLIITNTDSSPDLYVWLRDLNTPGPVTVLNGEKLKKNTPKSVQLQENGGKVSYDWAAEQKAGNHVYHWADIVNPTDPEAVVTAGAAPALDISLAANNNAVLPYMFRPYP